MIIELLGAPTLGGGELVGLELAEAVSRIGRSTTVWVPGPGPAFEESMRRRLRTKIIPMECVGSYNPLSAASSIWNVYRAARQLRHGIIHVHCAYGFGRLSRVLHAARVRRVAHVQIDADAEAFRWVFRQPPELIVTCADFLAAKVAAALPDRVRLRTRIEAVPNAVDTSRYQPGDQTEAKRQVGARPDRPLLLMLANLAPHKGQTTALKCVAELKGRGLDVECWLAGVQRDGNDFEQKLRGMTAELGIADRVRFLGFRGDADALLRAADALLLPSTHEGLPLVILEAQASNVPVLAAPTAGIPEVVEHERTGFLIPADDAAGYAACIARLMTEPGLRQAIVTAARNQVLQRHTWGAYCDRMLSLYDELLNSNRAAPRNSAACHANPVA